MYFHQAQKRIEGERQVRGRYASGGVDFICLSRLEKEGGTSKRIHRPLSTIGVVLTRLHAVAPATKVVPDYLSLISLGYAHKYACVI